ncbi:MAG: hypothetical protein E6J36_00430 [Chloroflexi bacterium]|nr:MAG: hypothetical protein E6J36_00430 [Chloroflexota bacterium]
MVGLCIDEGLAEVVKRGQPIVKRALPGAEALADDIGQMVVNDVLLGVHHLLEALHPQGFGGGRGDQQDVRQWRGGMRPLDIKRDFQGPKVVILQAGAIIRWRWVGWRGPLDFEDIKAWRGGRAVHCWGLPTHMREAEGRVKDAQVVADGTAAEGVDDRDSLALTLVTSSQ